MDTRVSRHVFTYLEYPILNHLYLKNKAADYKMIKKLLEFFYYKSLVVWRLHTLTGTSCILHIP